MTALTRHDRGTPPLDNSHDPTTTSERTTSLFAPSSNHGFESASDFPHSSSVNSQITPTALSFSNLPSFQYHASLHPLDTADMLQPSVATHHASPLNPESHSHRDYNSTEAASQGAYKLSFPESESHRRTFVPSSNLPVRTSSVKSLTASHYTAGSLSPASAFSSPGLGPLVDITPLPSPVTQPTTNPWANMPALNTSTSRPGSSHSQYSPTPLSLNASSPPKKRKHHPGLIPTVDPSVALAKEPSHTRNRSLSEYVPTAVATRPRNIAPSGAKTPTSIEPASKPMQREEYLAVQRGISALPTPRPPTPPRSNRGATDSSECGSPPPSPGPVGSLAKRYEARVLKTGKMKKWTAVRQLGTGTFSTVMLATSDTFGGGKTEDQLDPKSLVAVKICEHGPAGGADEKKIESSLMRELDILKAINHPSLVHLKAVNVLEKRAFLVLDYACGGDLFDLASSKSDLISPGLIRRMFAELVGAVRYLHGLRIVHRDIKLESEKC